MEVRMTKGKQKRERKKIDDKKNLHLTFTKRKSSIHKKATKVDIIMFSPTGEPFSYGDPSLQSTKRTSLNEENHSEDSVDKIVEAQRKMQVEGLNNKNDTLLDQRYIEEEQEKALGGLLKTKNNRGWWEAKLEDINYDLAKGMDASYGEFHKNLTNELGSTSHDQTSGVISNHTNGREIYNTSEGVFETNNEAYEIGASKNNQPEIFPMNQMMRGVNSNLTNYTHGSDISEVVFGRNNGISASNNDQPNFGSMFQMNEVNSSSNVTYASGSNISDFSFNPTNEVYQPRGDLFDIIFPPNQARRGDNILFPMINESNEKYGGSDDFSFPPINGYDHGHF